MPFFLEDRHGETFSLFVQISLNNWLDTNWKTLLETDFDILLRFKRKEIRLGRA